MISRNTSFCLVFLFFPLTCLVFLESCLDLTFKPVLAHPSLFFHPFCPRLNAFIGRGVIYGSPQEFIWKKTHHASTVAVREEV